MAEIPHTPTYPSKWSQSLFRQISVVPLVWLRILFGVVILWEVSQFFQNGWIFSLLQEPKIHFTYPGFSWVRPLEGKALEAIFYVLSLAAICVSLGLLYRLAIAVTTLLFSYIFLLESSLYLNHYYLFILLGLILCFLDANALFSLDAKIWPDRFRKTSVPAWQLWLVLGQLGLVYFWGGIAKLSSPDWLAGQPAAMWLAEQKSFPLLGNFLDSPTAALGIAWGGMLLDLLIFPALLWKKTRLPAMVLGILFHLINSFWFNIGGFPWFMIGAMLLFFPPETLAKWMAQLLGKSKKKTLTTETQFPQRQKQYVIGVAIVLWLTIQFLLPLRHFLIPGDVNWTYEGHRFSWRMKLTDRQSTGIGFQAVNLDTGEKTIVNHRLYLNPRQYAKLGVQTDMILQFAQLVKQELAKRGFSNIAVYANSMVSLNGRPPTPFINPEIDLLKVAPNASPSPLILPAPTSPLPDL